MDLERQSDIAALDTTLATVERVLDVDGLRARIEKLEHEASDPNLWDDQSRAQKVTSELSHTQGELRRVEGLRQRASTICPSLRDGRGRRRRRPRRSAGGRRCGTEGIAGRRRGDGGPYPAVRRNTTSARRWSPSGPAPGVDAADWAEMLMRMYIRWAEQHSYPLRCSTRPTPKRRASECDFRRARPVCLRHPLGGAGYAPPGADQPVRQPKPQADIFAEVEVLPVVDTTDHIEIPKPTSGLTFTDRAAGRPIGQHDRFSGSTAHIPTGIVVTCQNEKSQLQNKVSAMRVLQAKLWNASASKNAPSWTPSRGTVAAPGETRCGPVLHPLPNGQDLRTEHEVGNLRRYWMGTSTDFRGWDRWRNRRDDDN